MNKYVITGISCFLVLCQTACKKENVMDPVVENTSALTATQTVAGKSNPNPPSTQPVSLGNLTDYMFVFTDGSDDANWQGATKGFIGDIAYDGSISHERTSGSVPYSGTLYNSSNNPSAWEDITDQNTSQSNYHSDNGNRLSHLSEDLNNAFTSINALPATTGYTSVAPSSLDGMNTANGIAETIVINITSGMQVTSQIDITGDADDHYILRWDSDANGANGYQGLVKFQSGGAIVPHGALNASNFINVAGDISSSGGGSNPAVPYPQGPRTNNGTGSLIANGSNFNGGGFFTGYWLTTGDPVTHKTHSLSNAVFVGGWYSKTSSFSMTSGTSGVHVSPVTGN